MNQHVFICHATEDKAEFVRPLAERLRSNGVRVWYDEFSMEIGDSLRESIDRGLASCAHGIVILSPHFFSKRWANRELNGLVAREMAEGRNIIIPIWYNIDQKEIVEYSPPLADVLGIRYNGDIDVILQSLLDKLRITDPYTQLSGLQHVRILDDSGAHAKWIIERNVHVNREPLALMTMRASSAGEKTIDEVSPGHFDGVVRIGGTPTLRIIYDPPIPPGTGFTQRIIWDTKNMFNEPENWASIMPALHYERFILSVEIPYPNKVTEIRAFKTVGREQIPLPGLVVNDDSSKFSIELKSPEVGFLHSLAWKWRGK